MDGFLEKLSAFRTPYQRRQLCFFQVGSFSIGSFSIGSIIGMTSNMSKLLLTRSLPEAVERYRIIPSIGYGRDGQFLIPSSMRRPDNSRYKVLIHCLSYEFYRGKEIVVIAYLTNRKTGVIRRYLHSSMREKVKSLFYGSDRPAPVDSRSFSSSFLATESMRDKSGRETFYGFIVRLSAGIPCHIPSSAVLFHRDRLFTYWLNEKHDLGISLP